MILHLGLWWRGVKKIFEYENDEIIIERRIKPKNVQLEADNTLERDNFLATYVEQRSVWNGREPNTSYEHTNSA